MKFTFADSELKKHAVSRRECLEVLASRAKRDFDLEDSQRGNSRFMSVGFTHAGRLLEVGVELRGESVHVFHAMAAGKEYRRKYASK